MPAGNPNIAEAGKATQFKAGESGNPSGPKPGYKHINTHIQELLNKPDFEARILDPKAGLMDYKGKPIDAVLQVVLVKAINGDQKMIDILMKYGWSAKQEIDLTSLGESVAQPLDQNLLTQFLMNIENNTKR